MKKELKSCNQLYIELGIDFDEDDDIDYDDKYGGYCQDDCRPKNNSYEWDGIKDDMDDFNFDE